MTGSRFQQRATVKKSLQIRHKSCVTLLFLSLIDYICIADKKAISSAPASFITIKSFCDSFNAVIYAGHCFFITSRAIG